MKVQAFSFQQKKRYLKSIKNCHRYGLSKTRPFHALMLCRFHNSRAKWFFEFSFSNTSSAFLSRDRGKMHKNFYVEKCLNFISCLMQKLRISNPYRARAFGKPVCPNYGSLGIFSIFYSFTLLLSHISFPLF